MHRFTQSLLVCAAASLATASASNAAVISVNFNGLNQDSTTYPVDNVATLVGAVPRAASTFTNLPGGSGGPVAVNDDSGVASGNVTYQAFAAYRADTTGVNTSQNWKFMKGYLDMTQASNAVLVSGLPSTFTSGGYDVYLYIDGDDFAGTNVQKTYRIFDSSQVEVANKNTLTNGGYTYDDAPNSSGYVESTSNAVAGNYVVFRGLNLSDFYIKVSGTNGGPLSGFQIVSAGVPEPASLSLIGLAGLAALRRKRA